MILPPMRLKWAHLCNEANFGHGRYHIPQLLQSFFFTPNRPVFPPATLALMFDASAGQGLDHRLSVQLKTLEGGHDVGDSRDYPLTFDSVGEGYRLFGPISVQLERWPIPAPGDYAFHLRVDDKEQGAVRVRFIDAEGPLRIRELLPPPEFPDALPIEQKWVHMLADFDFQAFRLGALRNIVEYVRLPKRSSHYNLGANALVVLFEGEMVDGISVYHRHRLRLLDAGGQNVIPEGDLIQTIDFIPLSENRLGRRLSVPFGEGVRLAEGDYSFENYLDDQHLGTLDFHVLPRR